MTTQRQYEPATVFNARIAIMNHLWTPSDMYKGKKQEKPSWFAGFIIQKTSPQWHTEPALAGITAACGRIYQNNPHILSWPITDGDLPNPETGKHSEWAKGHWLFNASTNTNPPNVEIVQAGGQLVKLTQRMGVKPGDNCMVGVTAAVKQNDVRAVKLFLNAVVFSAPGEEIAIGNSVSGAELMAQAQKQGFQPTGFSASPGGFGGGMGGGFNPGAAGGSPGGFTPGAGPGAQTNPTGFAPQGTAQNGAGFGGGAASPFNGQTPQNPFGPR